MIHWMDAELKCVSLCACVSFTNCLLLVLRGAFFARSRVSGKQPERERERARESMGMACDADARGTASSAVIDGSSIPSNPSSHGAAGFLVDSGAAAAAGGGAFVAAGSAKVLHAATEGSQAHAPPSTVGMNAEETAMILASLSKGKFGPVAFSEGESDMEDSKHSDMEDLSDDDDDDGEHPGGKVHRVQQINFDGPVGSKLDFMDDAGFSHRFRNESNRVKSLVTKHISIDELRAHFDRPIIDVAKDFGICITLMKKICRRNGIKRWPHRQIRSLSKSIASMEAAMLSAHGGERDKYRDQIMNLKMKRESVIADPNKENAMRPKTPTKDSSSRPHHPHVASVPKLSPRTSNPQVLHGNVHMSHNGHALAPVAIKVEAGSSSSIHSSSSNASGSHAITSNSSHSKGGRWTSEEHAAFLEGIRLYGKDWRRVAQVVMTRSAVQTRTHAQKYLLKFAGRFPFDADGILKDKQHDLHEQERTHEQDPIASGGDITMGASPGGMYRNHSMMTPVNDDAVSRESWSSKETPVKPPRIEAMAMILNSPGAEFESPSPRQIANGGDRHADVPMYSPVSSSSSLGRALPSLAMPASKAEQPPAFLKQESPSPAPTSAEAAP